MIFYDKSTDTSPEFPDILIKHKICTEISKDLFWFTVQITQFQKSLITGFLMIEMDSHTHFEYTECISGMKMLFMVGGWAFLRG